MRILILLRTLPYPADSGGRLRAAYLANDLARRHEVALLAFREPRQPDPDTRIRAQFRHFHSLPLPDPPTGPGRWLARDPGDIRRLLCPEMAASVEKTISELDPEVIITGDPGMSYYIQAHGNRVRILDYVCVTTLQFQRLGEISSGAGQLLWALRRRKYAAFHRRIAGLYDRCLVNSSEDRADLLASAPAWRGIEVVPNGLDLEQYPLTSQAPEPATLVYPGATTYPPNYDAVKWFVEEILPRVRAEAPEVEFNVTGNYPRDGSAPQAPGVHYTGYVEDVRPWIQRATVCVVPLRAGGGGVRFKVLEAMALGTPMVSTAIGAEGVDYHDGENILMAEEPEAFAAQTLRILKSPELRLRLSRQGRCLIEQKYDWAVLGESINAMLEDLVAGRRHGA